MPGIDDDKGWICVLQHAVEVTDAFVEVQAFAVHTIQNEYSVENGTGFLQAFFQEFSSVFCTDEKDIPVCRREIHVVTRKRFISTQRSCNAAAEHCFSCSAFCHQNTVVADGNVGIPDEAGIVFSEFGCSFCREPRQRIMIRQPGRSPVYHPGDSGCRLFFSIGFTEI